MLSSARTGVPIDLPKAKLTLSIDEELLIELKAYLAKNDRGISEVAEDFFRNLVTEKEVVSMMETLGIERGYIVYEDVVRSRPCVPDASKLVREARAGRV